MESKNIYAEALERLACGTGIVFNTEVEGNCGSVSEGLHRTFCPVERAEISPDEALTVTLQSKGEGYLFREPALPGERLLILGGGHIGLVLSEFAARCGYRVTVADDRPEFCNPERMPWAADTICGSFPDAIRRFHITAYDYIVIVTRGHSNDALSLRTVLSGEWPAYLGMIGSRKRVAKQLEMLAEEGFDRQKLSRVCTPIGLEIGSVTPEEITVSILAQLIAYRRLPEHRNSSARCVAVTDLELEILKELADSNGPRAVATILALDGSGPRNAGAKMIIYPDGAIKGSIGGGSGEGRVIKEGIAIIGTGSYKMITIEMNAEVAAKDGMACGGNMIVLLEDASKL
ncbi:MAG: XdhC family protein [Oscillospiraceae bacterium]